MRKFEEFDFILVQMTIVDNYRGQLLATECTQNWASYMFLSIKMDPFSLSNYLTQTMETMLAQMYDAFKQKCHLFLFFPAS